MTGILNALIAGVSGAVKDTYFNLVSLLLPGNGTNGKQNNAFVDSSTANSGTGWPITPNGDVTQGTFSPFSQTGWSNRFDGSANYRLTIPDSTDLDLTGDFCLEMWVYVTANSSSGQLVCIGNENAGQNGFIFYLPGGTTTVSLYTNGGAPLTTSSGAIALNTWHHLALVRSGAGAGNTVIYVDGVSKGSAQITTSFTGIAANGLCIGQTYNGSFVGVSNTYISNVRLVKGSPVYTGAFTPPTSPLTAITNTVLLTCQSNRFVDTNTQTTAKTITVTGSPSVTPFSPFAPTAEYKVATVGGSGYFDGSGDYLTIANQTALQLSGDFTIDGWIYGDNSGNNTGSSIIGDYFRNSAEATSQYQIAWNETGKTITFYLKTSGGATSLSTSNGTAPPFSWNHFALVRSGSTIRLYCNGVGTSTATDSTQLNSGFGTWIGVDANNTAEIFGGYIANLRVVKGTAIYDPSQSTLTVPTALTTAVSGTSLLLNFTNAGVVDATAKNVLETEGNAQISTAQSKWGTGSIAFDGSSPNDYLRSPTTFIFSGDFVIEGWMYFSSASSGFPTILCASTANQLQLQFDSTGANYYLNFGGTSSIINNQPTGMSTNTWTHFAVVRSGTASNNISVYFNGTRKNQATSTASVSQTIFLGADSSGTNPFNGYLDDFRITVGTTRGYSGASITVPTAPFPLQ